MQYSKVWISWIEMTVYTHSTEMGALKKVLSWLIFKTQLVTLFSFQVFNFLFNRWFVLVIQHCHARWTKSGVSGTLVWSTVSCRIFTSWSLLRGWISTKYLWNRFCLLIRTRWNSIKSGLSWRTSSQKSLTKVCNFILRGISQSLNFLLLILLARCLLLARKLRWSRTRPTWCWSFLML